MKTVAIVPAAGIGKRLKGKTKKQFMQLGGKPIVARTLLNLAAAQQITEIILVVHSDELGSIKNEIVKAYGIEKVSKIIEGGPTRQESVTRGFESVSEEAGLVLIHDGVRPFVTGEMIKNVILTADDCGAAICAIKSTDTLKVVYNDVVKETLKRDQIVQVQTPQCFRYDLLKKAIAMANDDGFIGTDEASLVERLNAEVRVIQGSVRNIKITTPADLALAEAILAADSY